MPQRRPTATDAPATFAREADDGVDLGQRGGELVAVALGHAAGHDQARSRLAGVAEREDGVDRLLAGGLDERAGVDDDEIGAVGVVGGHETVREEARHDLVGVDRVLRTPQRLDPEGLCTHRRTGYRRGAHDPVAPGRRTGAPLASERWARTSGRSCGPSAWSPAGRRCPGGTTGRSCSSTTPSPASWSRSRSAGVTEPTGARSCASSSLAGPDHAPVPARRRRLRRLRPPRRSGTPPRWTAKVELVTDALRRLGKWREPVVHAGPALDPWGFRTTLRLAVTDGRAGLRRAASNEVVELDHCLVAHPGLDELIVEGRFADASEVTLRVGAATGERLALVAPTRAGVSLPDDVRVVGADELAAGTPRVDPRRRRRPALAHLGRVVLPDPHRRRRRAGRRRAHDGRRRARPRTRACCSTRTAASGSSPARLLADARTGGRSGGARSRPSTTARPSPTRA